MTTKSEGTLQTVGNETVLPSTYWVLTVTGCLGMRSRDKAMLLADLMHRAQGWIEEGRQVVIKKIEADFYRVKVDGEIICELYRV